ncbi:GtrA family protein [Cytobacillus sp. FJAT-54145]|uniref:GtrA family protein n=1 Tax=Cytobacillus spartinae TaxID=3299023 RepID=A0ABW6K9M6_9BACI
MNQISLILEKTFIRFLLVGVINTCVGLSAIFLFMNVIHWNYWTSTLLGNGVGAIVSFLLNRGITFNSKISYLEGGIRFFMVVLSSYFVAYKCSEYAAKIIFSSIYLSDFISEKELAVLLGTGLYTILNYFGQKYVVFKKE